MKNEKDYRIILYPKTLRGQREYKRATPRFVAISNHGYCLKWNADVGMTQFYQEARERLCDALECGTVWTVCVLFRPDPDTYTRDQVFMEVRFTQKEVERYNKIKAQHLDFLDKLRILKSKLMRGYVHHTLTSAKEYVNFFEEQAKELFDADKPSTRDEN